MKDLHRRKEQKYMGMKEIREEFRVVMPHFLKTMVYHKSTSMSFALGHIQNHGKMSKYYICGTLSSCVALCTEQVCGVSDVN